MVAMKILIKSIWMETEIEVDESLKIHDLIQFIYKQYEMDFSNHNSIYLWVGNTTNFNHPHLTLSLSEE